MVLEELFDNHIALLSLNRCEKRNAINNEMINSLIMKLNALSKNPNIGCIILTGGKCSFSAGRDLKEIQNIKDLTVDEKRNEYRILNELHQSFRESTIPIIAAVNGYALGLGAGLVTWCDMAVIGVDTKFGYPEVDKGILPGFSAIGLKKSIPKKISFEMLGNGTILSSAEAHSLSLVNRVVPEEKVLSTAKELAKSLIKNGTKFSRFIKQYHDSLFSDRTELEMEYAFEMMALSSLLNDKSTKK